MRLRVAIPLLLLAAVVFLVAVVRTGLTDPGVVSGSTTNHAPAASSSTTIPWESGIGVLPVIQVFPAVPADNELRPAVVYQPRIGSEVLPPKLIVVTP